MGGARRLLQLGKLHLNGQEKAGGGRGGRDRKKAEARRVRDPFGGVHGRRGVVEVVPDGRLGGERKRRVVGAVLLVRETAPQEDMVWTLHSRR